MCGFLVSFQIFCHSSCTTHFLCGGSHQKTLSAERGLWKQSCVSSRTAYTSAAIYSQHLWARPWKISRRRLWETWQRRWERPCDFPAGSWETSAQGYFCTWVSLIECVPSCSAGELEKSLPCPPWSGNATTMHTEPNSTFLGRRALLCVLSLPMPAGSVTVVLRAPQGGAPCGLAVGCHPGELMMVRNLESPYLQELVAVEVSLGPPF